LSKVNTSPEIWCTKRIQICIEEWHIHCLHEEVEDEAAVAEAAGGAAEEGGAVGREDGLEPRRHTAAGVGVGVPEVEHRREFEVRGRRHEAAAAAAEAEQGHDEEHH